MGCAVRSRLRAKYQLPPVISLSPFGRSVDVPDWAVHLLFQPCAVCQEARELRRRGQ